MKHFIFAKKSLGQNFLNDFFVVENICKSITINDKIVLEIGPGTGFLTKEIIKYKPKKLILVEKDERLIKDLNKNFGNFAEIKNTDALKLDINKLAIQEQQKINIIANLPYNIGTTLVLNWLSCINNIENIVVMLQKEVVDRICAVPKTKDYGKISVLIQSVCNVKKLFDVKPECFIPKPKVMSSVVKIVPKKEQINKLTFKNLNDICKIAFSQRRKKLSNVFKNTNFSIVLNNENIISKRAEELSVEEYIKLTEYYPDNEKR